MANAKPTSAAATVMTKMAMIFPNAWEWSRNAEYPTKFRFTAFNISSIEIRTITAFLLARTPYNHMEKRAALRSSMCNKVIQATPSNSWVKYSSIKSHKANASLYSFSSVREIMIAPINAIRRINEAISKGITH